jgi:ComF family protein
MPAIWINFKNHATQTRDFLIDLILPKECLVCGKEKTWLCPDCFLKINIINEESCFGCGQKNKFGELCRSCRNKFYFDGLIGAVSYADPIVEKIIKTFKYNFVKDLDIFLEKLLFIFFTHHLERISIAGIQEKNISPLLDQSELIIIPVPLHYRRKNWRGFNQSELLGESFAQKYNFRYDNKNLIRIKNNKPQAKLSDKKRKNNIKNCFAWKGEDLKDKNIILIDDVATSGSTLNECAKLLKYHGARKIWCLTVAKS